MPTAPVRRLDKNHDKTWGAGSRNIATGSEAAAQRVRCRLLVILGEWFLNTDGGVPWWQDSSSSVRPIIGAPRDLRYAESVIKAIILGTDGITPSLTSFSSSFNPQTRKWSVSATGTTVDGEAWAITEVAF